MHFNPPVNFSQIFGIRLGKVSKILIFEEFSKTVNFSHKMLFKSAILGSTYSLATTIMKLHKKNCKKKQYFEKIYILAYIAKKAIFSPFLGLLAITRGSVVF